MIPTFLNNVGRPTRILRRDHAALPRKSTPIFVRPLSDITKLHAVHVEDKVGERSGFDGYLARDPLPIHHISFSYCPPTSLGSGSEPVQ